MKTCKHCGGALFGMGANNAVLCIPCWAEIILRVRSGTRQSKLATEYGVSRQAVQLKVRLYGQDD